MNWKSYTRANVKNAFPGYADEIWIAKVSDFLVLQEPVVNDPAVAGESVTISTAHTFPASGGFIKIACQPNSVQGNGTGVGPQGAKRINWNPQFVVQGDSPELLEFMKDAINEQVIVLLKDATCPGGQIYQFGCDCKPVTVSEVAFASSTADAEDGQKAWTLTGLTTCKYFYNATITEKPAA